ncbi:hypothetical protein [Paraclostridium sordellii]|uniref:hypothetical protein n=1 Tax=Paraclostridium sordellii TaxID=1505 RepID=UPI0005E12EA0|nr:hypothetical protein [Paeniclostridium sordellii]CEQ14269.1 Uncharacterised protein [[Clostridium] sordellii] [Paeniclostridium sordellii]CEQ19396.1 Uncharacterised protein [[Clostridium] sordellii] [Paeniclostridium sordellii]CEQ28793.1 Uncharacterised protein [[Clostridium] sordellii] [Paeniclostridium sordellii]
MDIETLKNRIAFDLPIYLGTDKVKVVDICEILDIIEVEFESGNREFVEVSCLKDNLDCYKGIPLSLFAPRGGKR